MPFKSEKQRRYMHAKLPKLAAKWEAKYGSSTAAPAPAEHTHGRTRPKRKSR